MKATTPQEAFIQYALQKRRDEAESELKALALLGVAEETTAYWREVAAEAETLSKLITERGIVFPEPKGGSK